ncbi:hypothetical protein ACJX0J_008689, partial [Zea mays]
CNGAATILLSCITSLLESPIGPKWKKRWKKLGVSQESFYLASPYTNFRPYIILEISVDKWELITKFTLRVEFDALALKIKDDWICFYLILNLETLVALNIIVSFLIF